MHSKLLTLNEWYMITIFYYGHSSFVFWWGRCCFCLRATQPPALHPMWPPRLGQK